MKPPGPQAGLIRRFLYRVGQFQSNLLLGLVYVVLWLPVGLLTQVFADWLHQKPPAKTNWWAHSERLNQPEHLRESF